MLVRIVAMVAAAQGSRAPIQRVVDKVSGYFVSAVIAATVLATPMSIMAGVGKGAAAGVLIKSRNHRSAWKKSTLW